MSKRLFLICVCLWCVAGFTPVNLIVAQDAVPENAKPASPDAADESPQQSQDSEQPQEPAKPGESEPADDSPKQQPKQGAAENQQNSNDDKSAEKERGEAQDKTENDKDKAGDDEKTEDGEEKTEGKSDESSSRRSFFQRDTKREEKFSKRSVDFVSVFEPVVASASTSTVQIMAGRRQLALGLVVDEAGFVLTKASELKGDLTVKFSDGRQTSAKVYGIHPDTDLALLQVHIDDVTPVKWSESPGPVVGQWLATPNLKSSKLEVGVVGVNTRVIPPSSPFIGITMKNAEDKDGVLIDSVVRRSPADEADLWVSDLITHIDEVAVKDIDGLRKTLGQYDPGDRISLTIVRGNKEKQIKLTLAERDKISPLNDRSNQQNSMGSVLSRRRKDFPNAFQHDSMLNSSACGGPVVDLSGQVVGVNIARAGRVSSLSLPVQTVLPVLTMLRTGKFSPGLVNKERIVEIDAELKELDQKLGHLPDKKQSLESKYLIEKAKQEELQKMLTDVQNRLKVIELKSNNYKSELDSVTRELKNIEKIRQRLEADRKQLATGIR